MNTTDVNPALARLFAELVDGANRPSGAFILNTGDAGLLDIRNGLREEAHRWLQALRSPCDGADVDLSGMIPSITHLAYHLGAIRQIDKQTRGPREGTF